MNINTKILNIKITKHNDSLLVDISFNTKIVLPKALTIAIFFNVIKDLVFLLGREIILKLDAMIYEELKENLKRVGAKFRFACYCDRTLVTPFGKIFFRYLYIQLNGKHFSPLLTYIENNRECIYGINSLPSDLPAEAYIHGSVPVEKLQGRCLATE